MAGIKRKELTLVQAGELMAEHLLKEKRWWITRRSGAGGCPLETSGSRRR